MNGTLFLLLVVGVFVGPFVGFLPTIVGRNKKNCRAILALNFFLGWTFVGWVIALVWACIEDSPEDAKRARPLNVGSLMWTLILINIAVAALIFWSMDQETKVAAEVEHRQAEEQKAEAKMQEQRDRDAENRRAALQAAEDRRQATAEFETLPKWDEYGKPINRNPPGESALSDSSSSTVGGITYPPGVGTPEKRREYLQALTELRKQRGAPAVGRRLGN